jgi:hypothetical protein
MTDHDRAKVRGGEALRKHREKRRAKANRPPSDSDAASEKNSHTASTEGSVVDVVDIPQENEEMKAIMNSIVTTDREKMRKISILGLEDPADGVRHGRHKNEHRRKDDIIIASESSREDMRKISMLGFEDPADAIEGSRNGKHGRGTRRKEREKRPSSTGRARPVGSSSRRSKSDMDFDLVEDPGPRRRTRSFDNDIPLVEGFCIPEEQPRTTSLDLEQVFSPDEAKESDLPPLQVAQHEFASKRKNGPKEFSGVIEISKATKQPMRKVSALGMYDPVFGNVHKDMEICHASMVFEDMDLNDVPDGMRDMLGHTSEHTDPVMVDLVMGESSPQSSKNSDTAGAAGDDSKTPPESRRADFAPPRGSFARRVSRRNIDSPVGAPAITPSPPRPKSIKKLHTPIGKNGAIDRKSKATSEVVPGGQDQFAKSFAKSFAFIPPSGSFNLRKPKDRPSTPTREALLKDIELAARAQSMFAEDSLLAMSASNLEHSISNLGVSLGSLDFHASATSLDVSMKAESEPRKGSSARQPRKRGSQTSSVGEPQVPPPAKSADARRTTSAAIFSEIRLNGARSGTPRKPASHQPTRPLPRQSSSRSWEGDVELMDPMAPSKSNPMWASLSVLNTDFSSGL